MSRQATMPTGPSGGTASAIDPVPDQGSLHDLVRRSAARHPERTAVVGPADRLSYAELDALADELAHRLAATGVCAGDRVVIWAAKSARMVAAMQAVLRLGAAYVPVDASFPAGRAALIATDCAARAIWVADGRSAELRAALGFDVPVLDLDAPSPNAGADVPAAPHHRVDPDEPAYLLYTSGSTGTPKGVCLSHRNARAFVDWAVTELAADEADRFANHAPFSFDLSVLDLYAAFSVGAAVHLVPTELAYAPGQLVSFLHRERITVWYSVPSALVLMAREGGLFDVAAPRCLRAVVFAGEPFPIGHLRRLREWTDARLLNLYGPTETNVCTWHEVTRADLERDQPVPIGRASCGDRVWAVRPDGGTALPGEEGELLVHGPTVMLGYWGAPAQRGPYRTGDIVRVLAEGQFDYVGRRDQMVKVRGHRVELGEIEAVLAAHPDVDEAAVVLTGTGTAARLEVFVVPVDGRAPGLLALKRHGADRLPRYMLPDAVRSTAALPRTGNGKVDRRALAALAADPDADARPDPGAPDHPQRPERSDRPDQTS